MIEVNPAFWEAVDELVRSSEIMIDRPKGSVHPKYATFVYRVDYGYLKDTASMDGQGIDVWVGSDPAQRIDAVMCIVDLSAAGIAYYDPERERSGTGMTVRYARKCGLPMLFMPLDAESEAAMLST